jgi:hypothetical protein
MLCHFLRDGHLAGVEMLPLGLADEDAIARAHTLCSKRKGPFDGFEVWDRSRFVFRLPVARVEAAEPGVPDPWAMIFQRVVMMSEHADHRFSATLSSPDLALSVPSRPAFRFPGRGATFFQAFASRRMTSL